MAAATITSQRWGYAATGGVDATTVTSTEVCIDKVIVTSVGTAGGLCTLTTVTGTVPFAVLAGGTIGQSAVYDFGGAKLPDLAVTIGTTAHLVRIITK